MRAGAFISTDHVSPLDLAIDKFAGFMQRPLNVRREYFGPGQFTVPLPARLIADGLAGRKIFLTLRPAFNPVSSADLAKTETFLQACKAANLDMEITLWHEPFYSKLTAVQYIEMIRYYGPVVRKYYPLAFVTANHTVRANNENSYYPGDEYIDTILTDAYAHGFTLGDRLDLAASIADNASPRKPFGLGEFNGCPDLAAGGQTEAEITEFFDYIQGFFTSRANAGKPNADLLFFNADGKSGPGNTTREILTSDDFRIPLLRKLYGAMTTYTLTAKVTDTVTGEFNTKTASFIVNEPIMVGTDNGYDGKVWNAVHAAVPKVPGFRKSINLSAASPNFGMPLTWNEGTTIPTAAKKCILSWKPLVTGPNGVLSGALDAKIAAWAKSCQANSVAKGGKLYAVSTWHEGESDDKQPGSSATLTGPQIRSMHDHIYRIFKPLAPDVLYGQIWTAYLLNNAVNTLGGTALTNTGVEGGYMCTPELKSTVTGQPCTKLDFHAFDGYGTNKLGSTATPTAVTVYGKAFAAIRALEPGVVTAIAENNTEVRAYRPSWFKQTWDLAKQEHCLFWFSWWSYANVQAPVAGLEWDPTDTDTIGVLNQIANGEI
jgi:hypothetical protein